MNWRIRWAKSYCFGILLVGLTSAGKDTVVLATGESIEGHLVSADENTVQFRDSRGIIEEIPREKVSSIRLQAATALPKQPPTSTVEPEKASSAAPESPEEHKEFCELVTSFQKEQLAYVQETNPIRKAGTRTPDPYRYESQVRDLFGPKHQFVNWAETLRFGTSGRSIGITFTPTCDPQQFICVRVAPGLRDPETGRVPSAIPCDVRVAAQPRSSCSARLKGSLLLPLMVNNDGVAGIAHFI